MSLAYRFVLLVACSVSLACNSGASADGSTVRPTASSNGGAAASSMTGSGGGAGTSISLNVDAGMPEDSNAGSGAGAQLITTLPPGFVHERT